MNILEWISSSTKQPYILGTRKLITDNCNNWISKYLNFNFGQYSGRLADHILFGKSIF